ncbi:hypothetical protein [Kitasatospora kifunensis]|uniref:DUF397 domain-containing protein n=1 Tax=Kitasatospora kifunensis TaxID=58351 RepID=A0A7W7QX25_KITKI|nr:hypothetical protein [Kitasatospora kifunensis]MBB4921337.1 hypothetical protein [Kitasatospora kifunensis]
MERHDPYGHHESESASGWGKPKASQNANSCVNVIEFDNGDIWLGDTKRPDLTPLAFDKSERVAALISVLIGNDDRFYLDESERTAVLEVLETGDTKTALAKLKDMARA